MLNGTELPVLFAGPRAGVYRPISGECDGPGEYGAGARDSPYAQGWWTAKQYGVGIVTVMQEKNGTIWCETVDSWCHAT